MATGAKALPSVVRCQSDGEFFRVVWRLRVCGVKIWVFWIAWSGILSCLKWN
jgi:hypothetical protein